MIYRTQKTMKILYITGLCFAVAGLTGCLDREAMNATLANSCQKGVSFLLDEYVNIKSVKDTSFSKVADKRDGDTKVTLNALVDDNNLDVERSYSCNFVVKTGFLNNSFSANISQIDMGEGNVYGRKDGEILGGLSRWLDITKEAESAL